LALRDQVIHVAIVVLLAVNVYYAAVEPCTSAESVVYQRYASHALLDLWKSPMDVRLGLVYGVLARIATRLGGVSELTIRIPAILGGLLFWTGLSVYCRRLRGWMAVIAFLTIAANPWTYRAFSTATGAALAMGLLSAAAMVARNHLGKASVLAGLAMGADAAVAIPAMFAGAIAAALMKMSFWKWIDELLLPGLLAGLFLLLPALLIREQPVTAATNDAGTRDLVLSLLRQHQGAEVVRVAASSPVSPGLFFYRRRYHLDWIQIVPDLQDADYYLFTANESSLIAKHGLRVSESAQGAVIARR
jgi:hypothetical protein